MTARNHDDPLSDFRDHCLACGADSPAGARFCRRCGRPMAAQLAALTPARGPSAEHKQVTVLFADVQGSMAISERLGPEEWYRIVVRFFVILAEGVQKAGGVVNRFTGDGIMALFGAPIALEDHAQRACHTALRLRRALASYAAELRATHGVDLGVRMGLNSGEVVTATLGDGRPANYTAVGQTVHLAAMMERLAAPGRVLVSERTAALVARDFRLTDLGLLREGDGGPAVCAFELCGHGVSSRRTRRTRERSRFVGRAAEMGILERGLDAARVHRGAVIAVRGEVGVGKSRLCREFLDQCRNEGAATYQRRAPSHLRSSPYLSLILDLRRLFGIEADDPSDVVRARIDTRLRDIGGAAHMLAPYFTRLLGAGDPRAAGESVDFEELRPLIAGFARALGERRPAVVLIEDVHWLDPASARLLDLFLDSVGGTRVLVVLNFRPDPRVRLPRSAPCELLNLEPLGRRATGELLRNLLGDDPELAGLANEIRDRTRGNPFFIEELVTSLVETGVLVGQPGAYRPGPHREPVKLPSSVQAVLESRIDRLPAQQKAVLQLASVLGRTFSQRLLRRIAQLPGDELDEAVAALERAGFVVEAEHASGERHFAFRHPLMQEEAYYSQMTEARTAAHAEVARACMEVYAGRLDERASLIAHHWENARDLLQAALWEQRAASWVTQRNPNEGLRRWRRVCELLEQAPASPEAAALAVRARTKILTLGARLGLTAHEARRIFDEGRAYALSAGDPRRRALLYLAYAQSRSFVGDAEEGLELTREAARDAERCGDADLLRRLQVGLAWSVFTAGRFREALELCEAFLADAAREGTAGTPQAAYARLLHAMLCVDMGRPRDALEDLALASDLAWRNADPELLCQAYAFAPVVRRILGGDPSDALQRTERAVELAELIGSAFARVHAYWGHGAAHLLAGNARTASKILNGVILLARDHGVALHGEAGILADLALATLARGEGAVALSIVEEAVEAARRHRTALYEWIARLARAQILLETRGVAAGSEVEGEMAQVRRTIAEQGTTSLEPFVTLHLARLSRLRGDEARAEAQLRAARVLFAAMGSTG